MEQMPAVQHRRAAPAGPAGDEAALCAGSACRQCESRCSAAWPAPDHAPQVPASQSLLTGLEAAESTGREGVTHTPCTARACGPASLAAQHTRAAMEMVASTALQHTHPARQVSRAAPHRRLVARSRCHSPEQQQLSAEDGWRFEQPRSRLSGSRSCSTARHSRPAFTSTLDGVSLILLHSAHPPPPRPTSHLHLRTPALATNTPHSSP